MSKVVPDELVDLALEALDAEVKLWRRVPWGPSQIKLMRYSEPLDAGPSEMSAESYITTYDVPAKRADEMIVRFAMEKALEAVIGAISVAA